MHLLDSCGNLTVLARDYFFPVVNNGNFLCISTFKIFHSSCWFSREKHAQWAFMGPIIAVIVVSNVKDKCQRTKLLNEIHKVSQKKYVEITKYIFHLLDIQFKLNVGRFSTDTEGVIEMFCSALFRLSDWRYVKNIIT